MKKAITLILAFVLVLSLSATAFASAPPEGIPEVPVNALNANETHTFVFEKIYVDQRGVQIEEGKQPVEELVFTVEGNEVANAPQLKVTNAMTNGNPQRVKVTVTPAETVTLGKYEYTIKEVEGSTAGVTYGLNTMKVQVMIAKVDGKFVETVTFRQFANGQAGPKVTSIKNQFESNKPNDPDYGPLTIDKVVTGNMGDVNANFNITVTLTSNKEVKSPIMVGLQPVAADKWVKTVDKNEWTYTHVLTLNDGSVKVTISDVPKDVTFVVTEDEDHYTKEAGHDYSNEPTKGYDVSYKTGDAEGVHSGSIAKTAKNNVVVTNNKGAEVDTGISLDVLPYVIILGIAALGIVLFAVKRRVQE